MPDPTGTPTTEHDPTVDADETKEDEDEVDEDPTVDLLSTDDTSIDDAWKDILATSHLLKDDKVNIESKVYSCELPRFVKPKTDTTPPTKALSFSSAKNAADFGDDATSILADEHKGILMGLDTDNSPAKFAMGDIKSSFGIPDKVNGPVGIILGKLPNMSMYKDPKSNYNGVWIIPEKKEKKTDPNVVTLTTKLTFQLPSLEKVAFADDLFSLMKEEFRIDMSSFKDGIHKLEYEASDFRVTFTSSTTFTQGTSSPKTGWSVIARLPNVKDYNLYIGRVQEPGATKDGSIFAITRHDQSTGGDLETPEPESATKNDLINDIGGAKSADAGSDDFAIPANSVSDPAEGDSEVVQPVRIWYAELSTVPKTSWKLAFIFNVKINGKFLPMYLTYDKSKGDLSGGLWIEASLPDSARKLLPDYHDYYNPPANVPKSVNLVTDLGISGIPNGVPRNITKGKVDYSKSEKTLHLEFAMDQGEKQEGDVPAPFTWKDAKFIYDKDKDGNTSFEIESNFELNSGKKKPDEPTEDLYPPGNLHVSLTRKSNSMWELNGTAKDINFGVLAGFFDSSLSDSVMDVLGKLSIKELELDYQYLSGKASSFLFSGTIGAGDLEFRWYYQYASAGEGTQKLLEAKKAKESATMKKADVKPVTGTWSFDAFLSVQKPDATVKSVIQSIVNVADDEIPSFIADIKLGASDTNPDPNIISIRATKQHIEHKDEATNLVKREEDVVTFILDVKIDAVKFSFLQIAGKGKDEDKKAITIGPKRVLRLSIGPLPFIQDLPIVKELPQPYQLLTYCWVGGTENVTVEEVEFLNKTYLTTTEFKLFYKEETKDQKAGLRVGNHFIVINNDTCILDHVFGKKKPKSQAVVAQGADPIAEDGSFHEVSRATDDTEADAPPTKGSLKKESQFLSITGLSLQYKDDTLWIFLDASIKLGPIEMDLIGFGIGLKTQPVINGVLTKLTLDNLDLIAKHPLDCLDWQIHGLAASFDQPPVLIAGVFEHEVLAGLDSYRGGIGVSVAPYAFAAVGEYAKVTYGGKDYKSVFVYAKLDGPIVDLEIAIIKGARIGFGYNSCVRSPSVQELKDFPLINDTGVGGAGANPMRILTAMRGGENPWVQVKQDSLWFAFGFSVSCFDVLTATAVALLQFSDRGVIADIYADVIGMMPPDAKELHECIVYVELLMNAELNFIYDYFFIQAALAPTSFLLVPECHLYGGFACGTWFGSNDHSGDWVFTVGGYHRQFQKPEYYPSPDRLGIAFNIGDNMSIRGEGYFAICPSAVMGGAVIYVQLHVGPVSAHLTAGFDALINFHPLHYIIDLYVEVGVSCHVHILFISFDVSIDIGADLHIEGPAFGGSANVDFWFFGFTVYFGHQPEPPPPLHLYEFYSVVSKAGPSQDEQAPKEDHVEAGVEVQLKFALEGGAFPKMPKDSTTEPPPSSGAGAMWVVRGGDFAFRCSSVFAIGSASLATKKSVADPTAKELQVPKAQWVDKIGNVSDVGPISGYPMRSNDIDSYMHMSIKRVVDESKGIFEMPDTNWQPEFVVKTVPIALWNEWDPLHPIDPTNPKQKDNPPTVPLAMALSVKAPPPLLSPSKIGRLNATDIQKQQVDDDYHLAKTEIQVGPFPTQLAGKDPNSNDTPTAERITAWKTMADTWESKYDENKDVAKAMASACMAALGWDKPPPEVTQKIKNDENGPDKITLAHMPWELQPSFPGRLVAIADKPDLTEGLDNTYLALPRVIAVGA